MNHLIEEALEYRSQKLNIMNVKELKIESLKNQMNVNTEYIIKLRKLKYKTNSIDAKVAYQELIKEATDEYLRLEEKLNKVEASE